MYVQIERTDGCVIVHIAGRISGHWNVETQEQLRGVFVPGGEVVLDFSAAEHLTSLSLRRFLLLARYGRSIGCRLETRNVPAELASLVEAAGFLPLFTRFQEDPDLPNLGLSTPQRIDTFPTRCIGQFGVSRGEAIPFGATVAPRGVNFSLFARHADQVTLVLRRPGEAAPFAEVPIPVEYRIGDVWAITVFDLDIDDLEYSYRVAGPWAPEAGHRYNGQLELLDPFAQGLGGIETWGERFPDGERRIPRGRLVPHDFDWNDDRPLEIPVEDLVIYELHVRGFTRSPTSGVRFPGTFAGLREKIPYLKHLGVNCIELMPIFEFDECENAHRNPETGELLFNYWGYSTLAFCAPKSGYAATSSLGMQVDEVKTLIRDLHAAGIEVILDVVFNHTAELDETGPTLSFRGLDNRVYYMLDPQGNYLNFSGCGNTVNCNHPVVREFVRNCLRHWVTEYHIDGFRFDLASILGRDTDGNPQPNPPLLESLARDPVLSRTKLIAEAWDAGGLYQVGSFPSFGRWMEWNGRYRDASRRFLRGDPGQAGEMAQRFIGSPDMYSERGPTASVNFITCHDGFTLADLVSYTHKRNLANGEEDRDGNNENDSWNCGVEGETDDPRILELRNRQVKNALAMLCLSQGVPMLLMGDEVGRTQRGNNNAYCHDGPLTWFDWSLCDTHADRYRFCREMLEFRRQHPALRHHMHPGQRDRHASDVLDVTWHGVEPFQPDWSHHSRTLALMLRLYSLSGLVDVLYLVFNMFWEPLSFRLPAPPDGWMWEDNINTAAAAPHDIAHSGKLLRSPSPRIDISARSVRVLVARPGASLSLKPPISGHS